MKQCMDGNTAAAHVAYAVSEAACIYPITPSSTMAELCDEWASAGKKNIFDKTMIIKQMQSEAGAAGAVHGALAGGALCTTFTASQGLLLMIPNMYKIAGELLPCVFHVSARALASHALSIFGDHQDVMAARQTGFAMMCSTNVQECHDLALASHIATLASSVPFVHFFDGFRTSHEIQKIDVASYDDIKKVINTEHIKEFKSLALDPKNPHQRGTAQNPDIYFQNREACNPFYDCVFDEVVSAFADVESITGRHYEPYEYYGADDAKEIVVCMGSACETIKETIDQMLDGGQKVGLVCVRLFRPFASGAFCSAIPQTVKKIAVLDRTKESGATCEPLCADVLCALAKQGRTACVVGGRYGLGGKEFTPACAAAVFKNLHSKSPRDNFTVGIEDDVTNLSLPLPDFKIKNKCISMKFFGLGSDGTVSANKNSIKIIGDNTNKFVQGYFEYDSKKSGSMTISHLRVSDCPIKSTYVTSDCEFVCISNYAYISKYDVLSSLSSGGTVLLQCPLSVREFADNVPKRFADGLKEKNAKLYLINATDLAFKHGMGGKINTIMQTAFFKLTNIIDFEKAKQKMKEAIKKSYGKKGEEIVLKNCALVDEAAEALAQVDVFALAGKSEQKTPPKTEYYEKYIKPILASKGNDLPVSCFAADGCVPTDTSKFEKRGIAISCPHYIPQNCIECGRCVASCPHAALSTVLAKEEHLASAPNGFETRQSIGQKGLAYRIQLSPKDCTGCGVCSQVCPAKNKALVMQPSAKIVENEQQNYDFAQTLTNQKSIFRPDTIKGLQFEKPYFQFNGACPGCGETPYIKMLTQLFGKNMIIANATGCSSIYGGSAPTCPFSKDENGCGPAWANSLFEDNAEFGMGIKIARQINGENNSVWIVGGDGWAYDIGYGGLDHVLCSGENVNILVLDTEVYSNTGGQSSKSSQKASVAKFAAGGKRTKKKDLFSIAMSNQNCYVASVSMGYDMNQTVRAMIEAQNFDGPSLIIAYAPCINHGINMQNSQEEMKRAVQAGYVTLARFNPNSNQKLIIDSPESTLSFEDFLMGENRYRALCKIDQEKAKELFRACHQDAVERREKLKNWLKTNQQN